MDMQSRIAVRQCRQTNGRPGESTPAGLQQELDST